MRLVDCGEGARSCKPFGSSAGVNVSAASVSKKLRQRTSQPVLGVLLHNHVIENKLDMIMWIMTAFNIAKFMDFRQLVKDRLAGQGRRATLLLTAPSCVA